MTLTCGFYCTSTPSTSRRWLPQHMNCPTVSPPYWERRIVKHRRAVWLPSSESHSNTFWRGAQLGDLQISLTMCCPPPPSPEEHPCGMRPPKPRPTYCTGRNWSLQHKSIAQCQTLRLMTWSCASPAAGASATQWSVQPPPRRPRRQRVLLGQRGVPHEQQVHRARERAARCVVQRRHARLVGDRNVRGALVPEQAARFVLVAVEEGHQHRVLGRSARRACGRGRALLRSTLACHNM